MPIYEIAKIQHRRGLAKSGSGFPQLASGELGWAIDTQELYIGNGSVTEGSPAVGNTKIITEKDFAAESNVFATIKYVYKQAEPSFSGSVQLDLQKRLDDQVTSISYGTKADGIVDDTAPLQLAIDTLFLNVTAPAYLDTVDTNNVERRVVLYLPAGKYIISSTIYLPSYTTIIGAGKNKTIIQYTGVGPAFAAVNEASVPGAPNTTQDITGYNQPKSIDISNLTVKTAQGATGIQLFCAKDCKFTNIQLVSDRGVLFDPNCRGIDLSAKTTLVTCDNIVFDNVDIIGYDYGVYSKHDISNIKCVNCRFDTVRYGVALGIGTNTGAIDANEIAEKFGPRWVAIVDSYFGTIEYNAVIIDNGMLNTVQNCTMVNVGDITGVPQLYYGCMGNSVKNLISDRHNKYSQSNNVYKPEVSGYAVYDMSESVYLPTMQSIKLPLSTTSNGTVTGSISYQIDYVYQTATIKRIGTLSIVVDNNANAAIIDNYTYINSTDTDMLALTFSVQLLDVTGAVYVNTPQVLGSMNVLCNDNLGLNGSFAYTYKSIS